MRTDRSFSLELGSSCQVGLTAVIVSMMISSRIIDPICRKNMGDQYSHYRTKRALK
jgi:hypothetical protein